MGSNNMKLRKSGVPLDQNHIITAAINLLEELGFQGFSMRALATNLGVTVGATYRHFGGKEKILDMAADQILSSIPFSDGAGDWRLAYAENARAYRIAFAQYPGVASYLTLHLGETSVRQQAIAKNINLLINAGLPRSRALQAAAAINAFLRASAGEVTLSNRRGAGRPAKTTKALEKIGLDDASFELGLKIFVRGIEVIIKTENGLDRV
jgi:AcrR family transcriptional regulator